MFLLLVPASTPCSRCNCECVGGKIEVPEENIEVFVYPNPAKDDLNIDIPSLLAGQQYQFRICDALGRVYMNRIITIKGNSIKVSISTLKPGIYYYNIYNSQKSLLNGIFVKE